MQKAIVIGLARSGAAAANLLAVRGWDVTVTDRREASELAEFADLLRPEVKQALGGHPAGLVEGARLVVISPGVPLSAPPVKEARELGVEVIGELELAWRYFGSPDYFAVTGTNGKSTTVTLLQMMMQAAGRESLLGGNIGVPLCAALAGDTKYDSVVAEVSSFQLETIKDFRPRGAAVLNVTPDHLDRYESSIEQYRDTKLRISMNQTGEDYIVLNADDPLLRDMAGDGPRAYFFSRLSRVKGVFMRGDTVCYEFSPEETGELLDATEIKIKGAHNLENAMAASALALLGGCNLDAVREALREFEGLEHRLEFVRELDGVSYINDSKGTNVGAVLKSLESVETPLVLIAGGRDKEGDFAALAPLMKERARAAVLIGEAASKINSALSDSVECRMADTLEDAVQKARELAQKGDTVLLSPACASFDMFKSFEHRGREFKRAVQAL